MSIPLSALSALGAAALLATASPAMEPSIHKSPFGKLQSGAPVELYTLTNADGSISGVVKSVTIQSNGMLAELEDGKTLMIGAGVKIS